MRLVDPEWQFASIGVRPRDILEEVLSTQQFIGGTFVRDFESSFSGILGGTCHCVGVANGTDALELALRALGIGPGHRVAIPALSFVATSEAVVNVGAEPVFIDVDSSGRINLDSASSADLKLCHGVIAVHLHGAPCDIKQIRRALGPDAKIIEDCAQAHGCVAMGAPIGTDSDAAAWSFFPGKNLGALGDAGAVTSQDAAVIERIRRAANHGRTSKHGHVEVGRNSRLDAVQAAFLSAKLPALRDWTVRRHQIAQRYIRYISNPDVRLPSIEPTHGLHQFVVRTAHRDKLGQTLSEAGIPWGIHYPYVLPDVSPGRVLGEAPIARDISTTGLSLPIGEHLSDEEVDWVITVVNQAQLS